MQLRELIGYRQTLFYQLLKSSNDLKDLANKLKDNGYKDYVISSSTGGIVFAKPSDPYVIKIFRQDPGYEDFIALALANQSNPHVPRIKGNLVTFQKIYKIIRIERLTHARTLDDKKISKEISSYTTKKAYRPTTASRREAVEQMYPQLYTLLDKIAAGGEDLVIDLHKENIMFRGSIPVITDPYF